METAEKIYKLLEHFIENGKLFYLELENEYEDTYVLKEIDMKLLNEKYHILGCDINQQSSNSGYMTHGTYLKFETDDGDFITFQECWNNQSSIEISGYIHNGEYVVWQNCTIDIGEYINQTIKSYQQKIENQQNIINKYKLTIEELNNLRDEQTR